MYPEYHEPLPVQQSEKAKNIEALEVNSESALIVFMEVNVGLKTYPRCGISFYQVDHRICQTQTTSRFDRPRDVVEFCESFLLAEAPQYSCTWILREMMQYPQPSYSYGTSLQSLTTLQVVNMPNDRYYTHFHYKVCMSLFPSMDCI